MLKHWQTDNEQFTAFLYQMIFWATDTRTNTEIRCVALNRLWLFVNCLLCRDLKRKHSIFLKLWNVQFEFRFLAISQKHLHAIQVKKKNKQNKSVQLSDWLNCQKWTTNDLYHTVNLNPYYEITFSSTIYFVSFLW